HLHNAVGNQRRQFLRNVQADLEGLQITVIHSNKIGARVEAILELFACMYLEQNLQPEGMRKRGERFQRRRVQGSGDEQDHVCADRLGLKDLVFVNGKVLTKNGTEVELARRRQIIIAAAKVFLIGQHGNGR